MAYVIWTYKRFPECSLTRLKGRGMCYHVYVIGAYKRTHVDRQNMPNHCTSIYHEWMCVCVAALKVIVTRYTAQSVMRTCMLPRELIWERVAPSHTGVTQNSGWPLLQLLWSTPEKALSLMWCAISNVVSLSLSLSLFIAVWLKRNSTTPRLSPPPLWWWTQKYQHTGQGMDEVTY